MKSLKDRGLRELAPLVRRVKRAYAMERISRPDYQFLMEHLDQVEARIIAMQEYDETGEEVLEPHGEEAESDSKSR